MPSSLPLSFTNVSFDLSDPRLDRSHLLLQTDDVDLDLLIHLALKFITLDVSVDPVLSLADAVLQVSDLLRQRAASSTSVKHACPQCESSAYAGDDGC
ncbi:hypothetical protein AU106_gp014 [Sinorhizobium phage phiM9]|uniref:Uncharacterized protein n=1 Tax=Sinorhizobium phage phiM9 TaxID=1636182 RepID=A0A0F6R5Q2_9CAUD|nr:hypothetical protein AU106_gp014 [Sinorhizobium phage phiM9]AKE44645.1 hypothetical protein Sm_phiM9_015 [Sinorhizobium phage phiM9]